MLTKLLNKKLIYEVEIPEASYSLGIGSPAFLNLFDTNLLSVLFRDLEFINAGSTSFTMKKNCLIYIFYSFYAQNSVPSELLFLTGNTGTASYKVALKTASLGAVNVYLNSNTDTVLNNSLPVSIYKDDSFLLSTINNSDFKPNSQSGLLKNVVSLFVD